MFLPAPLFLSFTPFNKGGSGNLKYFKPKTLYIYLTKGDMWHSHSLQKNNGVVLRRTPL